MKTKIFTSLLLTIILAGFVAAQTPTPSFTAVQLNKTPFTRIRGTIFRSDNNQTVGEGIPVDIFCRNNNTNALVGSVKTRDTGEFMKVVQNRPTETCVIGDQVWLSVLFQNDTYTSHRMKVVAENATGGPTPKVRGAADFNFFVGVPEFNVMTLAIAIILGGLGLVILKKE